jgi:hypothetical protein
MAEEALEMARREKEILWKVKRLLRRFRGDADWVPGEIFEREEDEVLLLPNENENEGVEAVEEQVLQSAVPSLATEGQAVVEAEAEAEVLQESAVHTQAEMVEANGVDAMDMAIQQAAVEAVKTAAEIDPPPQPNNESVNETTEASNPTEDQTMPVPITEQPAHPPPDPEQASSEDQTSTSGKDTTATKIHAMTTRARARSPVHSGRPSPTPSSSASIPPVHPWFLAPATTLPDRDLGLPLNEAEESRRILLIYVQKQEHVVRQWESLSSGLLKADRMRRDIYRACKAEGHVRDDGRGNVVTEMSDGEDWYDPADWGLGERELKVGKGGVLGLEKGRDEVEEAGEEDGGRRGKRRRVVNRM